MFTPRAITKLALASILIIVLLGGVIFHLVFSAPSNFVSDSSVIVDPGQSISSVARELRDAHIVRSPIMFRSLVILYGGERTTSAGMYVFERPQNVFKVAHRISRGNYGYVPVKLTVPEGFSSGEIAKLVSDKFPQIQLEEATAVMKSHEGTLFPETYFFPPQATLGMIIDRLRAQFDKNIEPLKGEIAESGRTMNEIITMASILEEEVQNDKDRRLVADLLWRRLEIGMPLQVDSTIGYVTGKGSLELTTKDLQTDSPYNSYTRKGLPPTPISNPGLAAIDAAINPTPNNYLYFLSDKDGINHFAVTYSEHVNNRKKYLGK